VTFKQFTFHLQTVSVNIISGAYQAIHQITDTWIISIFRLKSYHSDAIFSLSLQRLFLKYNFRILRIITFVSLNLNFL